MDIRSYKLLRFARKLYGLQPKRCLADEVSTSEPKRDYFVKEKESYRFLEMFNWKKRQFPNAHKYNPFTITNEQIRELKASYRRDLELIGQAFIKERYELLGPDLATAHFIVFRGGKVRFRGHQDWISKEPEETTCPQLPSVYHKQYLLEAVDASNTLLLYEGLVNFTNLNYLKWLSFRNCIHVDDWFIDKISGEFSETLEYLDLSDCHNVTERSLNCLYRFRKLRALILENIVSNKHFQYGCALLEDENPNLVVEGVDYSKLAC